MQIDDFLKRLQRVSKSGKGWKALCPGHGDKNPSLSINLGENGRILLKDFGGGCTAEQIVEKLNLKMSDLFTQERQEPLSPRKRIEHSKSWGPGLTIAEYAQAKKLPQNFLEQLGIRQIYIGGKPTVAIPYKNERGEEIAVQFRHALTKGEDDNRFSWRRGSKTQLYGQERLSAAQQKYRHINLVEGASDAQTLWLAGEPAVGIPGADNWNEERDAPQLNGFETIYVVIENDNGGEAVKNWLRKSSIKNHARIIKLELYKDPSGLYLADPDNFLENWKQAQTKAIPWHVIEEQERREKTKDYYKPAETLLHNPKLLDIIGETIQARGYAGDLRPPKTAYVAITSRLLVRPNNLAFVAQSAAGKNKAVEAALELIPSEAVHIMKAGSERALIYTDADYEHKTVIVEEADSIPEEGPAASAVRSLAASNRMEYDVVEKNIKTNRQETRRISKPGPTGLITTSTKSLPPQMNTRTLEVPISDDEKQTRDVLLIHALNVQGPLQTKIDLSPFIALQQWLVVGGIHQVAIPFASTLARVVPAKDVRMRRDFLQLLTCIQAIALLYQCQRERTSDGWVLATFDDYAEARNLLAHLFDAIVSEGLTPAIRQTVEIVATHSEINQTELAKVLGLAASTVSWRVRRAIKAGWLIRTNDRPIRLVVGASLPDATTSLPTVEQLKAAFEDSSLLEGKETTPPPGVETKPEAVQRSLLPCSACGSSAWWQRPDGGWVCNVCHPAPNPYKE